MEISSVKEDWGRIEDIKGEKKVSIREYIS